MRRNVKRSSVQTIPAANGSVSGFGDLRRGKIYELKLRFPRLRELVADSEFSLSFTSDRTTYELLVSIPTSFPFSAPILSVHPKAVHPLLDETSTVIGIPELTAYSIHAALPDIVAHVLERFNSVVLRRSGGVACEPQSSSTSKMFSNGLPAAGRLSLYQETNSLSVEDLKEWSTNDLKVLEYVEKMPHIRARRQQLEELFAANEKLAKENMDEKENLEKIRSNLFSLFDQLSDIRSEIVPKQETFALLAKTFEPQMIKERLKHMAQEAESSSEEIADKFLANDMSVEDFLKTFAKSRTLSHERSAKAEVLESQLEQLRRSGYSRN